MVDAGDAEPRHIADRNLGNVLDLNRNAVELAEHDVLDVVDVIALRQILIAAAVEQSDAADVHGLLADRDLAAADIDVGIAQRVDDLRYRDAVGVELMQIDVDIVLLGRAAPRVHLDHAVGHGEKAARRDPVLYGAQIGQPEMRWTDHLVAVDLADQARLRDARHLVSRQRDVLRQA